MRTLKSILLVLLLMSAAHSVFGAEGARMTWVVDGVEREALVFAPTAESPRGSHPLIFAFHGHGGNMNGASHWGLHERWPQAIVVYPQGLDTPSILDPRGRKPGWQRLAGDQGNRDLRFTDAMLATMRQKFKVDDRRVFATGFSNGAFFTLLLWIERRDTFAAFAVVAGALDPSQHLTMAKPVLHIGGQADPLVTPAKFEPTIAAERQIDGALGQAVACGAGCTRYVGSKAEVRTFIHPGGHVYPPNAAELTVDFFRQAGQIVTIDRSAEPRPASAAVSVAAPGDVGEVVFFESHGVQLKGYLYKPQGNGPFPVYMWNHGSEQQPPPGGKLAQFWVPQGFVLFAPIRSGHGDNPGAYIVTEQKKIQNPQSAAGFRQIAALHERANDDVVAAYEWIARQSYVDKVRIVVAGGSFGGIQALLTAQRDARDGLGVKCVVSMSPAAEAWGNSNWAGRLGDAVAAAKAPIFLLQASNDYSLGPSEVLSPRIDAKGFPNRHVLFPAHGGANDHVQGHVGFMSDPSAWSAEVLKFVHDCGAKP
jgi:polyhydroxybutyrate depolymerase